MKLNEFFAHASHPQFFASQRIINLIVPSTSVLFVQACTKRIQQLLGLPLVWCDLARQSCTEIEAQLATSFLGTAYLYGIASEITKSEQPLLAYLEQYQGIHTVLLATKQEHALRERAGVLHLFVDEVVDMQGYQGLYHFLHAEEMSDKRFMQELFKRVPNVPLDTACVLLHYQQLVGKNNQQFFASWFHRIVEQKHSLFSLSQHLLARDPKQFYPAWAVVADAYPPEFWIAFWAEQLWQALMFVTIAQREGVVAAKKSASRLPFAFMQKDWQKHSLSHLHNMHHVLYTIDCFNKNGAITDGLAVWYAQFFQRTS